MTNSNKIEKLTPEQEADFGPMRDKWIKIGLNTDPMNIPKVMDAVRLAYECADGLEPPKYWIFTDGPTEAMKILTLGEMAQIPLTEDEFKQLAAEPDPMALTNEIRKILKAYEDANGKLKFKTHWPSSYGQHDAGWLGFQDYFAKHFGLSEKTAGLRACAQECGWIWFREEMVIVSAKPTKVTMLDDLLHNEKGPAIEYLDGTKCYSYNGVEIPEKWVMERETIDPSEILAHPDVDKRAAGAALYGFARMKDKLNYRIIEGNPATDVGALVSIELPGLDEPGHFLEAICPRNGPVFLGIPRTSPFDGGKKIDTAFKAQAFLAKFPASMYMHPTLRT